MCSSQDATSLKQETGLLYSPACPCWIGLHILFTPAVVRDLLILLMYFC